MFPIIAISARLMGRYVRAVGFLNRQFKGGLITREEYDKMLKESRIIFKKQCDVLFST